MSDYTDLFSGADGELSPALRQMVCSHQAMPDEVDADGRRLCPACGLVTGPPSDLAIDFAMFYLASLRQIGVSITEEHEQFAAELAASASPLR